MHGFCYRCVLLIFLFFNLYMLPVNFTSANATNNITVSAVKAGCYKLDYGRYKGYETDYDHSKQTTVQKEIFATLTKQEIIINGISTKYKIRNDKLFVNNTAMYQVIGNNKLLMLAGGGIIFEHE